MVASNSYLSVSPLQRGRISAPTDIFIIQRGVSTGNEQTPTPQQAPAERTCHNDARFNSTLLDKKSIHIEKVFGNKDKDVMYMASWREKALRLLPISVVASLLNLLAMIVQFRIQKVEAPARSRILLSIMWIAELGFAGSPLLLP